MMRKGKIITIPSTDRGQGAAHDYAVGYLIDRKGNDVYSVEGGNGLGLTNSVALFLDACGNDRYERNVTSNYGFANTARNTGSIGIFLDTGGNDIYPISSDTSGYQERFQNDSQWSYGTYGLGWDTLMVVEEKPAMEEKTEEDKPKFSDADFKVALRKRIQEIRGRSH